MYDAVIGRFHTVDPWAEKYPFQSPYAYAANNPIMYIDFMGLGATAREDHDEWEMTHYAMGGSRAQLVQSKRKRNEDRVRAVAQGTAGTIWHVCAQGHVTYQGIDYTGNHTLYSVDENGERGASVVIQDGTILDQLATDRPETRKGPDYLFYDDFKDGVRYAVTENRNATFDLFYFLSNNTRVEWALDGYVTNKKEYILATGHNKGKAPTTFGDRLPERDRKTINFRLHNHPAHNSLGGGPSSPDKASWRIMEDRLKGIRDPAPHYVYEVREQRLYWFGGYCGQKGVTRPTIRRASDLYRHLGF